MSNTIAVLLIIGSAVIGPLEAQYHELPPDKAPAFNECMNNQPRSSYGPYRSNDPREAEKAEKSMAAQMDAKGNRCMRAVGLEPMESLPELCDRAMREAGGETWLAYRTRLNIADKTNDPRKDTRWTLNGQWLECIPVPTGYKR